MVEARCYLVSKAGRADVDKPKADDGPTPLRAAAFKGHEMVVVELLKAGADVDKATTADDGSTPLRAAAFG